MDADVETIGESLVEQVGSAIKDAQSANGGGKLIHLKRADELLFGRDGASHLVDNFLDEMLEFADERASTAVKCFVISFIVRACKKDAEVMKKAVAPLYSFLATGTSNVKLAKKAMCACACIYPVVLKWAVTRKTDADVQECWAEFCKLKRQMMAYVETENEGMRTMVMKFLESVVVSQSIRTEQSDGGTRDIMNLSDIQRDHRFISYRQMSSEAQWCMQTLLDQTTVAHISSQNLLTVLSILCYIARTRPEYLVRVIDAIDVLQVNLPPTLGTSQVKAVRKELKMHLIRLLKHKATIDLAQRIATLLSDLGMSQSEIARVMPAESKKRAPPKEEDAGPSTKRKKEDIVEGEEDEDEDEGEMKGMESAIDVTESYIFDRLNHSVVTNLVFISLATLPNTMPAAFQSTYTPIASAGTEAQRRRLSRMMATQATQMGIGPGAEMLREQKKQAFLQRHNARSEGAIIPPTPVHTTNTQSAPPTKRMPPKVTIPLPAPTPVVKHKVQFNLVTSCKEMPKTEREKLFRFTLQRIMQNEKRAMQGGAALAQQKIIVRLVSRFKEDNTELEEMLCKFIIENYKSRSELALLWVSEMYAQYHGFSICFASSHEDGRFSVDERLARYNRVLVLLLKSIFEREEHKELLFHKLLLEAPLLTSDALSYLKLACTESVFGNFAITTLRELVLTRSRQREDLLYLLFHLTFYERHETRSQAVETVKELYELSYMRSSVRSAVERQLEECCLEIPPIHFIVDGSARQWTSQLYKSALVLPVASLSHDPSLIHIMAQVFSKCPSNDFKITMMRQIEPSLRVMGQDSEELLKLLDECPIGAESLVARIVHLLTERTPASEEIVVRLKRLHETRNTDVRSLLPILPGLDKADIIRLLPKFVLSSSMAKSFGQAVKRVLSTKNCQSGNIAMSPVEMIVAYHAMDAKTKEEKRLMTEHIRTVLTAHRSMSKESVSTAIEELLNAKDSLPILLFHTLVVVYDLHPALHSFLGNVLQKIVNRRLWQMSSEHKEAFYEAVLTMQDIGPQIALTLLSVEEMGELLQFTIGGLDTVGLMKNSLNSLSSHQQRSIPDEMLTLLGVKERPCEVRDREREKERREREKEREEKRERERDRRRDDRRDERRSSARRSYAIGER